MIRVTVELYNANKGGERSTLAVMDICNVSGADHEYGSPLGNYRGVLYRAGTKKILREGHIKNWPRKSYPVMRLVCRMLREIYPQEKGNLKNVVTK